MHNSATYPEWLWGCEKTPLQPLGTIKATIAAAFWLVLTLPVHLIVRLISPSAPPYVQQFFHKKLCKSLGINIRVYGNKVRTAGTLYIANHMSWADIPVLGSQLLGSFVAKAEVATWGFWGWMARQQDTIYIVREKRHASSNQIHEIVRRLEAGRNVILFPEGTTSSGRHVLPFKSTLFAVINQMRTEYIQVQPISLAYTHINGLAVTRAKLPNLAWCGDDSLGSHVANFMRLGQVNAQLYFHAPLCVANNACRKEVAQKCYLMISETYNSLLNGRF